MASIKVKFLPSSRPGGQGRLCYLIHYRKAVRQLPTDYRIMSRDWNARLGVIDIEPDSPRRDYLLSVAERLGKDMKCFRRVVSELVETNAPFAIDTLVDTFERRRCGHSFFLYMGSLISRLRLMGKLRTSETYSAAYNSLTRFTHGHDLEMDELTPELMEMYQAFLSDRGLVLNTISFHMRILRAVYNRACSHGLVDDKRPFRRVYTGVEKTKKRALDLPVIRKIKNIDLTADPEAGYARDLFLLSFYFRGMSFVDMAFLQKSDLRNGYISYRRRKTGQRLTVKLTREMSEIMDRYPENLTPYLLPIITSPTASPFRQYRLRQYSINRALKNVGRSIGLDLPLTFYCSRHSWASIAKAKGVPVGVISDGLGHESELTTQIYLSTLDVNAVDHANDLIINSL